MGHEREYFIPTLDRVLVDPLEPAQPEGQIYVDRSKEPPTQGVVIAVGPGPFASDHMADWEVDSTHPLAVGAIAVFSKYGGTELTLNGHKFLILAEKDILGIRVPAPAQSAEPTLLALSTEGA